MTQEELDQFNRVNDRCSAMAIHLKHMCDCSSCLHRLQKPIKENCPGCIPINSKWEWGGWKGKPNPDGTKVWCDTDNLFEEFERNNDYDNLLGRNA